MADWSQAHGYGRARVPYATAEGGCPMSGCQGENGNPQAARYKIHGIKWGQTDSVLLTTTGNDGIKIPVKRNTVVQFLIQVNARCSLSSDNHNAAKTWLIRGGLYCDINHGISLFNSTFSETWDDGDPLWSYVSVQPVVENGDTSRGWDATLSLMGSGPSGENIQFAAVIHAFESGDTLESPW